MISLFPYWQMRTKKIINGFGVWGPKKFMGREFDGIHRKTFIMNETGTLWNA